VLHAEHKILSAIIWPSHKPIPRGWRSVGKDARKAECLRYIESVWTDDSTDNARHLKAASERHISRLLSEHPDEEAMSLAVGGGFEQFATSNSLCCSILALGQTAILSMLAAAPGA
jgi:uncharacterized protein YbdZ (MbtH family)